MPQVNNLALTIVSTMLPESAKWRAWRAQNFWCARLSFNMVVCPRAFQILACLSKYLVCLSKFLACLSNFLAYLSKFSGCLSKFSACLSKFSACFLKFSACLFKFIACLSKFSACLFKIYCVPFQIFCVPFGKSEVSCINITKCLDVCFSPSQKSILMTFFHT